MRRFRTTVVLLAAGMLWAGAVAARAAAAPPQGAAKPSSPAQRPEPCAAPEYRQFDFWLGEWVVHNPAGKQVGTSRIEGILSGCALAEHWTGAGVSRGTSLNFYDAQHQRWHQTWIDNQGAPLELDGHLAAGKMVLEGESPSRRQPGKMILNRITGSKLDRDRVQQVWEVSPDGGKTWKIIFDGTYVHRQ